MCAYDSRVAQTCNNMQLDVGPGKTLLELGCGRGRIAHHVARLTGAKVVGLNIGDDQIANAIDYANTTGPRRK